MVVSLELFYNWGGIPIRSQRENSLRTQGAFTEGDESPQDDEVACSSIVWVLAYYLEKKNLTRKLKIYGPKINRCRKAIGV